MSSLDETTGTLPVSSDLSDTFNNMVIKCLERIDSRTDVYIQFARLIREIGDMRYYDEGEWIHLKYGEDYSISSGIPGETNIIFSDRLIEWIDCKYKGCRVLPNMMFVNPSHDAKIKYVPIPEIFFDIRTVGDKGVRMELPERYHEAIACYASFLALSKEGKNTQDIQKSQIYLERYRQYVEKAKGMAKGSVNVDLNVLLPFRV